MRRRGTKVSTAVSTMEHRDLPRAEAISKAEELARQGWQVHFKYTCSRCGTRLTLDDANILYDDGECAMCGYIQPLDEVGFLLLRELTSKTEKDFS